MYFALSGHCLKELERVLNKFALLTPEWSATLVTGQVVQCPALFYRRGLALIAMYGQQECSLSL